MSSKSVLVSCRMRSYIGGQVLINVTIDLDKNTFCILKPLSSSIETTTESDQDTTLYSTQLDYIFPEKATQYDLFTRIGIPFAKDAMSGYNCTLLTYGQIGRIIKYNIQ